MAEEKAWHEGGFWDAINKGRKRIHDEVKRWGDDSPSTVAQRENLNNQGGMSSWFADSGQENYGRLGQEADANRAMLRDQASGKVSLSGEQLRQGLQQNMAAQRSMAASASPNNSAMAARTAAMQMGRQGAGLSGAAATAGIQERRSAQDALAQQILAQRGQDMNVALGSRQNAISAYGGIKPEDNLIDKYAGGVAAGFGMLTKSDRRAKHEIADGDGKAKKILEGLKAHTYKYKNEKDGKGDQFGPMAQDMEAAGLGHAVIDTPDGKMVHGAKAAISGLALTAALAKRVKKLEGKK